MKKILALVLVLALVLSMTACAKEEDLVGAWERESIYLEAYGCECTMYMLIAPNGTYIQMLMETGTVEILNIDLGDWELEGNKIVAQSDSEPGTTTFKIRGDKLQNGDLKYTQTERADEMFQLLYSAL